MATLHFAERSIELSLAYFGPLQAGCGTNVRHLHRLVSARDRSELRRVGGKDRRERMWRFSYLPVDPPRIPGFEVRVRVGSIPSGPDLSLDRDEALTGVDGIVFVVDARATRADDNLAALLDLEQLLARQGLDLGSLPIVLQVNRLDAPDARPPERAVEALNPFGFPVHESMARKGEGVRETHDAVLAAVLTRLRDNTPDHTLHTAVSTYSPAYRAKQEQALLEHAAHLPQARRTPPPHLQVPPTAEIPCRVPQLKGATPLHHIRTELQRGRLRVEAIYARDDGTHRKLAVLVEPGADETPRPTPPAPAPAPTPLLPPADDAPPGELPRLAYGLWGLVGGLVSGVLLGYLWFG